MAEKEVHVRLNYNGEFQRTGYVGGTSLTVPRVEIDTFSFCVLMEYVVDHIKVSEIGGVYISKGKRGGWKLVTCDQDLAELVNACKHHEELNFYLDMTVDKEIDPICQVQPHVIIRPRKNLIQVSVKKPPVKRKFVIRHQLQQQLKKMNNESPEVNKRKKSSPAPVLLSGEQDVALQEKGSARRRLELQDAASDDENTGENDVVVKVPPPPLTEYEKEKIRNVQKNEKVYEKLGLPSLISSIRHDIVQNSKGRGKQGKCKDREAGDDYIPENEGEDDSDDSSEIIRKVKAKKVQPGPRTRSRVNAAHEIEKEPRKASMVTEKEVTSSYRPPLLKPTCSKMFKQSKNGEAAAGSVAAYLALRERQKKNEALLTIENVGELNVEETANEEVEEVRAPRKPRGPTKMGRVHARGPDEKIVISLNEKGQAIADDSKIISELSNFCGVLARDNISLTYINWHVVPDQLKKKLWEYALGKYVIPDDGQKWVYQTFNEAWRLHKARMKAGHYSKYRSDGERLANRPNRIPLEDFKILLKYWGDESVQKLAEDNAAHRKGLTETHTMGPKPLSLVREKLKKSDPNLAPPSDGLIYLETRKQKPGWTYKTDPYVVKSKITEIQKMLSTGNDAEADAIAYKGKSHARNWLVGRRGKKVVSTSTQAPPTDQYVTELTTKIRNDLEIELEAKVNRKVQENMQKKEIGRS